MATKTAGGNNAFHNFHNDFAHIEDPNERRRLALAEIDKAPFGWYHIRAILVAGTGFFTDSYDIFCVSLLTIMLGIVYKHDNKGTLTTQQDTAIKLSTSAGTVIGQFGFGALADIVGRKKMYGLELILIIIATLAQSLVGPGPGTSVVGLIIFWRVLMGIGIGGDYPLSSIITSEFATTKWRGAMMGAVFAMQGFGQLGGALVMLCLVAGFKHKLEPASGYGTCTGDCQIAVDKMWRALIGIGVVPACIALYYRLTIPETPRYTFDVARDVEKGNEDAKHYLSGKKGEGSPDEITQVQARRQSVAQLDVPKASFGDFFRFYGKLKNGKILFGTAMSWLLLDVAFYGLGLNSSTVLQAIGYAGGDNLYHKLFRLAAGNCILVCAGAIPGYWLAVATIDTVGRKPLQLAGFTLLTILFIIWGFAYHHLSGHAMLGIYILIQLFFNWGPNSTTFIVPGECFPTRYRSTSHGISAGMGKIGSIIAQGAIAPLRTRGATAKVASPWLNHVMQIFAAFMFAGIFTTLLIPETKRRTLEDLAQDWDMGNESITGGEHAKHVNRSSDEGVTEIKS
ncbi:inorganic phosphate transporter 1-6 /Pi cotransporter [Cucurbitaria berberidis CBS 394.84]|uniref:Inorganic phosphate transporter 1-6 /Pi cotransporter n=1 Tax=Cucurbitaria berberidis CBS 394.84 TaxID=1168544 RepID=A0A9P4GQM3_9PLEO|nr:inorganic phosphate transporter 1-6 /Pi cotransporter [Cucurbitaria berberidis CBS 394.84]KAF1849749.1 inorganic phosphate transporter 1-6 /Pi cotransporter [Cucurbitaria berberidis CBS 394.84]